MTPADSRPPRSSRPPLRIAHVVSLDAAVPPKTQNGLEFMASWLVEGLVKRGHTVTLFAPPDSETSATLVSIQPNKVVAEECNTWRQPFRSIWNTTVAAMRADEFDIIHSHARSIVLSAPFIKIPIVHTLHHPATFDAWWKNWFDPGSEQTHFASIVEAYGKLHNVAVSQRQKELFQAGDGKYFFPNVDVIPNGIPVQSFTPSYDAGEYLLYLGYIVPEKGPHKAIEIARRTGKKLILAGSYHGFEEYFKSHIEPYLDDNITYFGVADFKQKTALYQHAEALVVPLQWDEPFGLTLVEAMACGTPVIAFDRGAAPEIVADGMTGFICQDVDDAVIAVAKINQIDRRNCRQHAEQHFDSERMIEAYEDFYYSLLQNKK